MENSVNVFKVLVISVSTRLSKLSGHGNILAYNRMETALRMGEMS
jgi:hypothetical protein